jgi:hypothetical protein
MQTIMARVIASQYVTVELDDEMVEKYGIAAVAEEYAIESFDLDSADWEVTDVEVID